MGNYTIFICLLLQGVPYFYAHECTIAPVSVTENLFLGTTTKHSEIFTPVQTTIKLWGNISTLLPKSHAGPGVVWSTPNIALILGQKNLLKLEHIHTGLGLDKPMMLNVFAVYNGIISTFYTGKQFLDTELILRVFANISSHHASVTPPRPIVEKGIYILELRPPNHTRLQKLNWLSYNTLSNKPYLTGSTPDSLILEKILNIKSLVKNILNKAILFSKLITWEPIPKSAGVSELTLFLACSLRINLEIPCLEYIKESHKIERLASSLTELSQSQGNDSHVLERTLKRLSLISNNTKTKYKSFGNYAKVITSWQTHVYIDPDDRNLPHIIDTAFDYEKWSKNFRASSNSPHRIIPYFESGNELVMSKVAEDTPNQNELDIMEQIMFLDNVYILQQFWSFLSKQNMQISQELEHTYILMGNLKEYLDENTRSLINQMTGDKTCNQNQRSIECNHGPIKMFGTMDGIKVTSRHSMSRNKTYFTLICPPSEEIGGFRNFIWDGQIFAIHKDTLTNSENQFPLACITQQKQYGIEKNCNQYFHLQQRPQSIFLFGNILVEPTPHERELCFSQITPDGILFDKYHTHIDLDNKSCLDSDRFPVYLHDREYSLDEIQQIIRERLRPYEQIQKHVGKWTQGVPLWDFTSTLKENYEGIQKFFIDNTHIWNITLSLMSFVTILGLIINTWKQHLLSRKKATRRVVRFEEETNTTQPLINRIAELVHFSSPNVTDRDFENAIELN